MVSSILDDFAHESRIVEEDATHDHNSSKSTGFPSSSDDHECSQRDILRENRDISQTRAKEELARWMKRCKEVPDDWELLWGILRDARTWRIRKGLWNAPPEGLSCENVRPYQQISEEDHSTEEETLTETYADVCAWTSIIKMRKFDQERPRSKRDLLRSVMSGSSVQKKSQEKHKSVNKRKRHVAHGLQDQLKKTE